MNAATPAAGTVSTEGLARLLMLSTDRVRQLVRAGHIPRAGHGRYSLIGACQGYFRFLKDKGRNAGREAADGRLRDAKAEAIQRRMDREDAYLVDLREALGVFDEMTSEMLKFADTLPPLIAKQPAERTRVKAIVDADARRLRRSFARIRHGLATGQSDTQEDGDE
ncbi:hypothetical protein [Aminobacter sp. AP02]|uniref:hypothetical protein n=1 Tax=Aminobacter sp. AP02 TaxID=2135737 RepID=UPI000D6D7D53|nr:hypothetical protein [Aminobacter sp. AP02]PWK66947.1 hypothetical protein C8K44_11363 [Aminobacter sp. AP02]